MDRVINFKSKFPQDVIVYIDGNDNIYNNRNRDVYMCCSHHSNTLKYNTIEDLKIKR